MNAKHYFSYAHQLYPKLERLISATPMLSLEEEQVYALRGTDAARERLVLSHLRLVKSLAFSFSGYGVDVTDLFNQGVLGLIKAVDRYSPSRGRLATFARHFILGEIISHLNKTQTFFHFPDPLRRSVNKFRSISQKLGECATDTEIAEEMQCSVDQVGCFRECAEHTFESLDARLVESPDEEPLSDTIGSIDPGFVEIEDKLTVSQLLSKLSAIEREVISLRYGFNGSPLSLREVGGHLGKSHEWVSKIEKAAMTKLRKHAKQRS